MMKTPATTIPLSKYYTIYVLDALVTTIIEKSSPDIVNALIYIATKNKLTNSKITPGDLISRESLSSKITACYANAHAERSLYNLVKEGFDLMRELTDWPMGYNIDANSRKKRQKARKNINKFYSRS